METARTHHHLEEECKTASEHAVLFENEILTSTTAARWTQIHRQESHSITDDVHQVSRAIFTYILHQMTGEHCISSTVLDQVIWVVRRSGKN